MRSFYSLLGVDTPFDPTYRFATSWLLPPWALFGLRIFMSLYAFTTIIAILTYTGVTVSAEAAGERFPYFTSITYWGLAFYTLFAAIHTFGYAKTGTPYLNRWPRPLQALQSVFYSTIVTLPILVTVVFWAILFSPGIFNNKYATWSNISQHALNSFYALTEIIIPRTSPPPWLHLAILIIILALYVGTAYITYADEGIYVYDFLNPKLHGSGRVAIYAVIILAAIIIIFLLVVGMIYLRRWLTEKVAGMKGKFARRDATNLGRGIAGSYGYEDREQIRDIEVAMVNK
ncbi:MAG: hypothetical protein M4579_002185 [Chaenotheca gracillima]|nr:MAG: hypothetical protein M4579_002185 [Chaenotheca gracillima]